MIVVDDCVFKLYLIFFGIFYFDMICLIGFGMVVDFKVMFGELDMFIVNDIDILGFCLVLIVYVMMFYYCLFDQVMEKQWGV